MSNKDKMLEAALQYAAAGKRIFPVGKDKVPIVTAWGQVASSHEAQIRAWWEKEYPGAGIGTPTGPAIGAWVFDVDCKNGKDGFKTLAALESLHGHLPATTEAKTGSGGRHLYFAWPTDGTEIRNSDGESNSLGEGLDVRGNGGYCILPPSNHPSGGVYEWTRNGRPALAPAWLVELATRKQEPKPRPRGEAGEPTYSDSTTAYGRAALEDECARVAGTAQGGRNAALNAAACKVGHLVAGGEITREDAEAALLNAALRCGLPEHEAGKTIKSGLDAGERDPKSAPGRKDAPAGGDQDQKATRPAPVPFDAVTTPEMDATALPLLLGEFIEAVAEGLQVPQELVLGDALACMAVAAQRKFLVVLRTDYGEPLNLYIMAALPPGERKSATVEVCRRPLIDWESEVQEASRDSILSAVSERKTLEKIIDARRNAAAKAKVDQRKAIIEEIKQLERELPEVPATPRLLLDDVTPEALAVFLERQGECAGIVEAEGGLVDILAGRYSKGAPNLDCVLKAWSGEAIHVDRRNGPPIVLREPALTLCLTPQPAVVRGLADTPGFRGRGLTARFLFLLPQSRVGMREVEPRPIPPAVLARYAAKISSILDLPWNTDQTGRPAPYFLRLAPEAYQEWLAFHRDVEGELRPGGDLELIADWGGKLHGAAARLAGVLHLFAHDAPHVEPISLETMRQALSLAALLAEHARAAFSLMGQDPDIECARHVLAWIQRKRMESFTARDALNGVRGRYPKMEQVNAGLAILVDRAYVFPREAEARPGPGRKPSAGYVVNPLTYGGAA